MIEDKIDLILKKYQKSFADKNYSDENDEMDLLMDIFGLTPQVKRENRQYWGRELGMCWQLIVTEVCKLHCPSFKPALKIGGDEPCDLIVEKYAIDTKYRIGSGDSGTLKKFKQYGKVLSDLDLQPVFLILRHDNLPAAIGACRVGGWKVCTGDDSFDFIQLISGFNLKGYLLQKAGGYSVNR